LDKPRVIVRKYVPKLDRATPLSSRARNENFCLSPAHTHPRENGMKFSFKSGPPTCGERNPTSFSPLTPAAAAARRSPREERTSTTAVPVRLPSRDRSPPVLRLHVAAAHRHSHCYPQRQLHRAQYGEMDGLGGGGARPVVYQFLAVPPDLFAEDYLRRPLAMPTAPPSLAGHIHLLQVASDPCFPPRPGSVNR
jgi:hypothetical protein